MLSGAARCTLFETSEADFASERYVRDRAARRRTNSMNSGRIDAILFATHDANPNVRRAAVRELCPCEVRANRVDVWDRILELAGDSDPGVRRLAFHSMIDGSPREREAEIVVAVEALRDDANPKLRRQARKLLDHFRRTGRININGG